MARIVLLHNPRSKQNQGRDRLAALARRIEDRAELYVTHDLTELESLLESVLMGPPIDCLVCNGGDGTLHWILNKALPVAERLGIALPPVLPARGGTINFVAYKAGLRGDVLSLLARLEGQNPPFSTIELDTIQVDLTLMNGSTERRIGFALAAGGVGQRFFDRLFEYDDRGTLSIVDIVVRAVSSLGWGAVLPGSTYADYAREIFRPHAARVWIDGELLSSENQGAIHAGSFDINLGGVFHVFPLARSKGTLHLQAGSIRAAEIVANLPRVMRGGVVQSSALRDTAGTSMRVEISGREPLRPVFDGERIEPTRSLELVLGPPIEVVVPRSRA